MPDAIADEKRALRADLRERRQVRSQAARERAGDGLRAQLDALIDRLGARSVSCYVSTPSEPDTRAFVDEAVARGIRVLLPTTRDDGLLDWSDAPGGALLGPVAVDEVDLMIVPAAAVDRTGMRLGWGRGYFDRTLGGMRRHPPVYAVVFDSELLDEVPREVHDQPVTGIVTPTQTIAFAPLPR